jgi:hypothetical protein
MRFGVGRMDGFPRWGRTRPTESHRPKPMRLSNRRVTTRLLSGSRGPEPLEHDDGVYRITRTSPMRTPRGLDVPKTPTGWQFTAAEWPYDIAKVLAVPAALDPVRGMIVRPRSLEWYRRCRLTLPADEAVGCCIYLIP